jgi:hypothetical protein
MLGAFEDQAQTNYFFDGKPIYNQYADTYDLGFSTTSDYHNYTVEWSDKFLAFSIDNRELKTWRNGDIPAAEWPQVPMQVKIGVWAVTEDSPPGEIEWAGGLPDWNNIPFAAYYDSMQLQDKMAWCHAASETITYDWGAGVKWEEVKVLGCERRAPQGFTPDHSASVTRPMSTASEATSSTVLVTTHHADKHVSSATKSTGPPETTSESEASGSSGAPGDDAEDSAILLGASYVVISAVAVICVLAW